MHGLVGIITSILILMIAVFVIFGLIKLSIHDTEENRIEKKNIRSEEKVLIRNQSGIVDTSFSSSKLKKELKHPA